MGVDWGHVIIGMQARLSICARELPILFPPTHASGLEITTWVGDIGGGAAMLAFRRVTTPNKRAIDMFNDQNNFGGWFNIEGDISAYLVGRDVSSFDHTPSVEYTNDRYVADIVESYLLPQPAPLNSDFNKRGLLFLAMLGGEIDEHGNLTNEEDVVKNVKITIQDFAEYYLVNMSLGGTAVDFAQTSRYLGGASLEMAYLLINSLKSIGYNPSSKAHPQNFNPSPSPPGEPYQDTKFTSAERVGELRRQVQEWINHH